MNKEKTEVNSQEIIEQLRSENELKTKWISLIAHDFKGLFSNISFLLDAFDNKSISQEMFLSMLPELKQITIKNIKTLESTFAWVNSQTEGFELLLEDIPIYDLFTSIKEDLNHLLTLKNITLEYRGDESMLLSSDKFLLTFILKQTIENSIKYSHKDEKVIFGVNRTSDGVCIEIKDFGLGMKETELNNVFTLNGAPYKGSMGEKGAGLSLVVIKDFVERMNGQMNVMSEKDKGTIVKFLFSE